MNLFSCCRSLSTLTLTALGWTHSIKETGKFFEELPFEEKEKIEMKNEKSFLGWSRVRPMIH